MGLGFKSITERRGNIHLRACCRCSRENPPHHWPLLPHVCPPSLHHSLGLTWEPLLLFCTEFKRGGGSLGAQNLLRNFSLLSHFPRFNNQQLLRGEENWDPSPVPKVLWSLPRLRPSMRTARKQRKPEGRPGNIMVALFGCHDLHNPIVPASAW